MSLDIFTPVVDDIFTDGFPILLGAFLAGHLLIFLSWRSGAIPFATDDLPERCVVRFIRQANSLNLLRLLAAGDLVAVVFYLVCFHAISRAVTRLTLRDPDWPLRLMDKLRQLKDRLLQRPVPE